MENVTNQQNHFINNSIDSKNFFLLFKLNLLAKHWIAHRFFITTLFSSQTKLWHYFLLIDNNLVKIHNLFIFYIIKFKTNLKKNRKRIFIKIEKENIFTFLFHVISKLKPTKMTFLPANYIKNL